MTPAFILTSALKDLRRRATDPTALVFWLGIPLLVGGLMALTSGGSGQAPRGVVLVADADEGLVGQVIEASLARGPLAQLFAAERVAEADGRARVAAGDATALVIVPRGAADAIVDRTPVTITLVTNPAQRILPGIVEESLEMLIEATFYLQRLFGPSLQRFRDRLPQDDDLPLDSEVGTLATTANAQLRTLRTLLFPPALEVKVEPRDAGATGGAGTSGFRDFGRLFLPGLLFMSLLFIAQGMSADVWEEQTQGTLRRALSAPPGVAAFLLGKVLAGTVLMAAVAAVGLMVGIALFDVAVLRALAAWPWAVFGGSILLALFLVPQVAATSQRVANLLTSLLVFPLMMIGGSFFPFESMPGWMAAVGRWTPNGQAVARLKELLDGTASVEPLAVAALAMLLPAAAALAWAVRRLHRRYEAGA